MNDFYKLFYDEEYEYNRRVTRKKVFIKDDRLIFDCQDDKGERIYLDTKITDILEIFRYGNYFSNIFGVVSRTGKFSLDPEMDGVGVFADQDKFNELMRILTEVFGLPKPKIKDLSYEHDNYLYIFQTE